MAEARDFHLVLTRDSGELLLVRRPGAEWRALQDEFPDYMTSLGPYTIEEAIEMCGVEWPDIALTRQNDMRAFAADGGDILHL